MPEFVWTHDISLGIEALDYEHRELFERVNALFADLARHENKERIENVLGDIHARMAAHFALEEEMMKAAHYIYRERHKREHEQLLDELTDVAEDLLNSPDVANRKAMEASLKRWILHHVRTSDLAMARAMEERP